MSNSTVVTDTITKISRLSRAILAENHINPVQKNNKRGKGKKFIFSLCLAFKAS